MRVFFVYSLYVRWFKCCRIYGFVLRGDRKRFGKFLIFYRWNSIWYFLELNNFLGIDFYNGFVNFF